ncbi:hypothetical protein AYI69_g1912 [Smittium culicis]|uniref:Uncharacterized protein n=1 Tax=Smittium culicis TaxID=133412 RepID=A0A1R1YNX6_9FUNG|nr:hypothetical protein AYI69_g1912 [Smittium culicis]
MLKAISKAFNGSENNSKPKKSKDKNITSDSSSTSDTKCLPNQFQHNNNPSFFKSFKKSPTTTPKNLGPSISNKKHLISSPIKRQSSDLSNKNNNDYSLSKDSFLITPPPQRNTNNHAPKYHNFDLIQPDKQRPPNTAPNFSLLDSSSIYDENWVYLSSKNSDNFSSTKKPINDPSTKNTPKIIKHSNIINDNINNPKLFPISPQVLNSNLNSAKNIDLASNNKLHTSTNKKSFELQKILKERSSFKHGLDKINPFTQHILNSTAHEPSNITTTTSTFDNALSPKNKSPTLNLVPLENIPKIRKNSLFKSKSMKSPTFSNSKVFPNKSINNPKKFIHKISSNFKSKNNKSPYSQNPDLPVKSSAPFLTPPIAVKPKFAFPDSISESKVQLYDSENEMPNPSNIRKFNKPKTLSKLPIPSNPRNIDPEKNFYSPKPINSPRQSTPKPHNLPESKTNQHTTQNDPQNYNVNSFQKPVSEIKKLIQNSTQVNNFKYNRVINYIHQQKFYFIQNPINFAVELNSIYKNGQNNKFTLFPIYNNLLPRDYDEVILQIKFELEIALVIEDLELIKRNLNLPSYELNLYNLPLQESQSSLDYTNSSISSSSSKIINNTLPTPSKIEYDTLKTYSASNSDNTSNILKPKQSTKANPNEFALTYSNTINNIESKGTATSPNYLTDKNYQNSQSFTVRNLYPEPLKPTNLQFSSPNICATKYKKPNAFINNQLFFSHGNIAASPRNMNYRNNTESDDEIPLHKLFISNNHKSPLLHQNISLASNNKNNNNNNSNSNLLNSSANNSNIFNSSYVYNYGSLLDNEILISSLEINKHAQNNSLQHKQNDENTTDQYHNHHHPSNISEKVHTSPFPQGMYPTSPVYNDIRTNYDYIADMGSLLNNAIFNNMALESNCDHDHDHDHDYPVSAMPLNKHKFTSLIPKTPSNHHQFRTPASISTKNKPNFMDNKDVLDRIDNNYISYNTQSNAMRLQL